MHRFVVTFVLILTLPAYAFAKVNVLDHGAKANGQTDDTAAIQKALDAAGKDRGGVVEMPKGLYRVQDHLVVPPGVCLSGEWQAPHHANTEHGTVILATGNAGKEDGPALINLQQGSGIKGVTVFYPDQDPANVKPYPWAIQGRGMHGSVIDVTLVNPYKGIDFGTHHNELHYIRNVFGCPLKIGVYVNNTTDIGRIENVHFNPHSWGRCTFNTKAQGEGWGALCKYLEQNLVGFRIGKTGSQAILLGRGTTIFQGCHFAGWATDKSDAPCIDVQGGAALIQSCDFFKTGKPQLRVGQSGLNLTR